METAAACGTRSEKRLFVQATNSAGEAAAESASSGTFTKSAAKTASTARLVSVRYQRRTAPHAARRAASPSRMLGSSAIAVRASNPRPAMSTATTTSTTIAACANGPSAKNRASTTSTAATATRPRAIRLAPGQVTR